MSDGEHVQPVPQVSADDVQRIIRRDFPLAHREIARSLLERAGDTSRVHMAILKLSEGKLSQLKNAVEIAGQDYRDVLAQAEYPSYTREVRPGVELPPEGLRSIVERDWVQYEEWLRRD